MKTVSILTFYGLILVATTSHAQTLRQMLDHDTIRRTEMMSRDADDAWRNSKKITVEKDTPDEPRKQGQCLQIPADLEEGAIGYLDYWQFTVLNIVDDKNMLIVLGSKNPIWLTDYPTANFADEDKVRISGPIIVEGTKEYETVVGGKKTVRVIRLVDDAVKTQMAEEQREKEFRYWKSADGKFSTNARLVDFADGMVILEKRDGKIIKVKPISLSREDQSSYRSILRDRITAERQLR